MKKTALCGVMVALALIFSFIETFVPVPLAVPGIKLGLANIVIVFSLYKIGRSESFVINMVRIIVAGVLFGSMTSIMYALVGGLFSFAVMAITKEKAKLHIITVSICGAVAHIMGQIVVAGAVVGYKPVAVYMAPLLVSALVTGALIGILSDAIVKRIKV